MPEHNDKEVIVHQNDTDERGRPIARTRFTPRADTRECAVLCEPDAVIPIVFLPGIMGTNLRRRNGGSVWRPPNLDGVGPVLGGIGSMIGYFFRGAATRQKQLNPEETEIDDRGPISTKIEGPGLFGINPFTKKTLSRREARKRGWGALMRSAYHPVMSLMERDLNNLMENAEVLGEWSEGKLYRRAPAGYGEEKGAQELTKTEIEHAAKYRFEIWGGGYNWLASNDDSGKAFKEYIEKTVLAHYREEFDDGVVDRMKVILVTHSMGGFVARALTGIHGDEQVLGAVLGVMPALGAPATYKRMRTGFESFARIILGRNAGEVVSVMANAPGGIELLPTPDYGVDGGRDEAGWLRLGGASGGKSWSDALPKNGDPYGEIYKSREWYGLVPAHNEALLDPAGASSSGQERESEGGGTDIFRVFDARIDNVRVFHAAIGGCYPAPAYAHYGDDSHQLAWSHVHWDGPTLPAGADFGGFRVLDDTHRGELRLDMSSAGGGLPGPEAGAEVGSESWQRGLYGTIQLDEVVVAGARGLGARFQVADAAGYGDATVPAVSGRGPGLAGVVCDFRQGDEGSGAYVDKDEKDRVAEGYEHQDSYNDPRTQWATLYGIVKIAQEADWACD